MVAFEVDHETVIELFCERINDVFSLAWIWSEVKVRVDRRGNHEAVGKKRVPESGKKARAHQAEKKSHEEDGTGRWASAEISVCERQYLFHLFSRT